MNFKLSGHVTNEIKMNEFSKKDPGREFENYSKISKDCLISKVPKCFGWKNGKLYLENLMENFKPICATDIKLGFKSYWDDDNKMSDKIEFVDGSFLTDQEKETKLLTKCRYMEWRDLSTTTRKYGMRIEGFLFPDGVQRPKHKTFEDVCLILDNFNILPKYVIKDIVDQLRDLINTLYKSEFFSTHKFIGVSVLILADKEKAIVKLIDFLKVMFQENPNNLGVIIGLESLIYALNRLT